MRSASIVSAILGASLAVAAIAAPPPTLRNRTRRPA